jgi:hypothetical protein
MKRPSCPIPVLISAALAIACSGKASTSSDQRDSGGTRDSGDAQPTSSADTGARKSPEAGRVDGGKDAGAGDGRATDATAVHDTSVDEGASQDAGPLVATYVDVSAGTVANTGGVPSLAIDTVNSKVLIAAEDSVTIATKLFQCNLDGSACVDVALPATSGTDPSLAIDGANSKLVIAFADSSNQGVPGLIRCNLDGTSCSYIVVSVGPAQSGGNPSLAIDEANSKLLIATEDASNGYRPALFRCNLDGSSCTYADISAGTGVTSGEYPSIGIDSTGGKLVVVTQDQGNAFKPALFRCNLDGTSCAYTDISAGAGTGSGATPKVAIDTLNAKLLVATRDDSNNKKPGLFRCNLDGTACAYVDISAGATANSGIAPSIAIDETSARLFVATDDGSNSDKPALFACSIDGSSCTYSDISAGAGASSGVTPSLAVDGTSHDVYVVTDDGSRSDTLSLFWLHH